MRIKKGDTVLILSGKDRARTGKVTRVLPKEGRVVVEGINIQKKHTRPRKQRQKGEIVEVPVPFDISNVKLICPKCSKPTRVGYKMMDKKKLRVCKKCHQEI